MATAAAAACLHRWFFATIFGAAPTYSCPEQEGRMQSSAKPGTVPVAAAAATATNDLS